MSIRLHFGFVMSFGLVLAVGSAAMATPTNPVYTLQVLDVRTDDNQFIGQDGKRRWDVDAGADQYQIELYERPTIDSFDNNEGDDLYSSQEYFEYLDIKAAKFGFDSSYMFVAIELVGPNKVDQSGPDNVGIDSEYGFRFSLDPDGRNGYLVRSIQPESEHGTTWGATKTLAFQDTDGDVGGASPVGPTGLDVTKDDNPAEESGPPGLNGFDAQIIVDGRPSSNSNAPVVLYTRIDPNNANIVEIALDYSFLGLTMQDIASIQYLDAQAIEGSPTDPQNYFWNDKYDKIEAGSPYNLAEFGAENGVGGYNNIDQLDTVRLIPEPTSLMLLTAAGGALLMRRHRG